MRPRRPLDESPAAAASDPATAATGDAFIKEQLAALTAIITSVKSDIGQAEARTVAKIDTKVDVLAVKLQTRMSRAETDLARLGTEMAVMREPLDALKLAAEERERGLPALVESIVRKRQLAVVGGDIGPWLWTSSWAALRRMKDIGQPENHYGYGP